jgi:metal-responsive CopG/Arc/MetJ family transcriptional regulator
MENVKQPHYPAERLSYIGVRIPTELLDAIDAMATESWRTRSEVIRELLQFALDVKHSGR